MQMLAQLRTPHRRRPMGSASRSKEKEKRRHIHSAHAAEKLVQLAGVQARARTFRPQSTPQQSAPFPADYCRHKGKRLTGETMAEQACNWCGAAVAQGICTRCGLSADEAPQTTSFSPAAFASFDPALADTDPDLPIIPGFGPDATLQAAPGPSYSTAPPPPPLPPPGPGSWSSAPISSSYPVSSHGSSQYGTQYPADQPPSAPAYYVSQPVGVQYGSRPKGAQQFALVIVGVAAVLLIAGAIMVAAGIWGPNPWIAIAPAPSATDNASSNPARTAAPPAPTHMTNPPSSQSSSQRQPTTSTAQAVTSLPSGTWITILESLPKNENTLAAAQARATGMAGYGPKVSVIDSDAIPGLNGGYWALGVTGYGSRESATAICGTFGREAGGSCYPRQVG